MRRSEKNQDEMRKSERIKMMKGEDQRDQRGIKIKERVREKDKDEKRRSERSIKMKRKVQRRRKIGIE